MTDLAPLPDTPLGRFRHYKGGEYEVVGVVRHSETLEPLVLYRPLRSDVGLWVRPHAMFFGQVDVDGALQPRFARVQQQVGQDACPLCNGPNACALASGSAAAGPCWCASASFSAELLDRVPPASRGMACICAACAAASLPRP